LCATANEADCGYGDEQYLSGITESHAVLLALFPATPTKNNGIKDYNDAQRLHGLPGRSR
jgi:hypothetical protein